MKLFILTIAFLISTQAHALGTIACVNGPSSLKIKVHSALFTNANAVATTIDSRGKVAAYTASAKSRDALITAMKSDRGVQFKNVEGKGTLNVKVVSLNEVEVHGRMNADMSCRGE